METLKHKIIETFKVANLNVREPIYMVHCMMIF